MSGRNAATSRRCARAAETSAAEGAVRRKGVGQSRAMSWRPTRQNTRQTWPAACSNAMWRARNRGHDPWMRLRRAWAPSELRRNATCSHASVQSDVPSVTAVRSREAASEAPNSPSRLTHSTAERVRGVLQASPIPEPPRMRRRNNCSHMQRHTSTTVTTAQSSQSSLWSAAAIFSPSECWPSGR